MTEKNKGIHWMPLFMSLMAMTVLQSISIIFTDDRTAPRSTAATPRTRHDVNS
jgi:polysaccharide deacetylase 2 family uncharacterized protein YibQ